MFARKNKLSRQQGEDGIPRFLRSSLCVLTAYFCLSASLAAEERFQLFKSYTKIPDSPPAKSFTLLGYKHQITFMAPQDSVVQLEREKKEVWIGYQDDRCLIKVQLSTNSPSLASTASSDQLHQLVQARYPEAEVGPAIFCYNSCSPGLFFDIQRPTAYKTKLITRIAFVPCQDGMLEVSLTASDAKFRSQLFALTGVLNSFLVEKPNPGSISLRQD